MPNVSGTRRSVTRRPRAGARRPVPYRVLALAAILAAGAAGGNARAAAVTVLGPGADGTVPVAGAAVSLWQERGDDARLLGRWTTGERGEAAVPRDVLEQATLLVVTGDAGSRQDVVLGADRERLRVILQPGLSRRLVVRDSRGEPVTRFRWTALPWVRFADDLAVARSRALQSFRLDGPGVFRQPEGRLALAAEGIAVHEAETDDGSTVMEHLEEGEHLLLLGAPGYGVQALRFDPREEGPLVVRLPDPDTCRPVRVIDRDTEQPLADVVAAPCPLLATGPWRSLWPAFPTSPDGLLPTGCPEVVPWVGDAVGVLVAPDHAPAFGDVLRGDGSRDASWRMDTGVTLEGTASDEEDHPLVGMRVVASIRGVVLEDEVAADGSFRIRHVPRGTVHVAVRDEAGRILLSTRVDTREGDHRRLDLSPGRDLAFRLARNGEPWTGVRVALLESTEGSGYAILGIAEPGLDGLVRLPGGGGEVLSIAVLGERGVLTAPLPPGIGNERPRRPHEDPPTLDLRGRIVEGRVIDADTGEPVDGAIVEGYRYGDCLAVDVDRASPLYVAALGGRFKACHGLNTVAGVDDSGRFRLFLPEGIVAVDAEGPPVRDPATGTRWTRDSRSVDEIVPGEPLVFRLRRSAVLLVTASTPDGRIPPGCTVGWRAVASGPRAAGHESPCRPGGVRLFPPPGVPIHVTARADGFASLVEGPFTLAPGRQESVSLTFARPGSIRLELARVPTIGGRPVLPPGTLRDAAGRDMLAFATIRGTRDLRTIVFSGLPPGRYVVEILGERERVELKEGEQRTVRIGF